MLFRSAAAGLEAFWARQARELLTWDQDFHTTLEWDLPFAQWFVGGTLNMTTNCLDRHVEAGRGDRIAYFWEGEPGDTREITYAELLDEVSRFANVLKGLGLKRGDRVAVYMPMIPELPVAMLAWYSRNPRAVKLLSDWSRTWTAAAVRAADGKPAGVFPAAIHFGDERLNGTGSWWNPGLGDLYRWKPQDLDMVWGKILLAYQLTGDETLLRGIHSQLDILRKYQGKRIENPDPGSLDWVGMQLQPHLWLARWYRSYTGRDDYDDLIGAAGGYGRFQLTGKTTEADHTHAGELAAMRFNLPMLTTEVRGTDRINLLPFSLVGPMTGGPVAIRSEEHTSELQSLVNLVCRPLLEKKNSHSTP